jgi:ribose-phosphate pyrophosphokinase
MQLAVFVPYAGREFGESVCASLEVAPSPHEEREFEDGEHKIRPLVSVRGRDVFVVQNLFGEGRQSVNDKFCRLAFFIGALQDASAARITLVAPYLCYARKDRRTKSRDPVTTRYVAQMLEALGTDGIVTLDTHNPAAFENAFRIPADHLEAKGLFASHFAPLIGSEEAVVVSPDTGGSKRAEAFRVALESKLGRPVASAFVEKHRSMGVVTGGSLAGDVSGKIAIILDDLVTSGTTLARAADVCLKHGAKRVYAAATHGVFSQEANAVLAKAPIERLAIANTIPVMHLDPALAAQKLVILDAAPLVAEAIRRIHTDGSLVELLES